MNTSGAPTRRAYSTLPMDMEARIPSGTVLQSRYTIVHELARGGMAIVYRATDHLLQDKDVAFKVVTARADRGDTELCYENEARLGSSLAGHANIVPPLAVGRLGNELPGFEGRMYLVTPLIEGDSLRWLLRKHRGGLPYPIACRLAREVALGLVALHERGIVHRDIKPDNVVVLGSTTRALILDFGLAYATGDGWVSQSPDLTEPGKAPGTLLYMSPQQLLHERPNPAFDIHAFGVMLYEMLAGDPPYSSYESSELVLRKCNPKDHPYPLTQICPDLPPILQDLVSRCLAYASRERPTAQAIVAVFDEVLDSMVTLADHPGLPTRVRAPRSRSARWAIVGTVPVAIAVLWTSIQMNRWFVEAPAAAPFESSPPAPSQPAPSPPAPSQPEPSPPEPPTVASRLEPTSMEPALRAFEADAAQPPSEVDATPPLDHSNPAGPTYLPSLGANLEPPREPVRKRPPKRPLPRELPPPVTAVAEPEPLAAVPDPGAPVPIPVNCEEKRRDAVAAVHDQAWTDLLALTNERMCWPTVDATVLRMTALRNLGRGDECIAEGKPVNDPRVARYVQICAHEDLASLPPPPRDR